MENIKKAPRRGLKERLATGETILCAEGYLLAFVRAGYVLQGLWVPEFVLDYPDVLRNQHYEFVRAGSDVTEAYQYLTDRKQMKYAELEDKTEEVNRTALRIARNVAEETGTLFAGGISNLDYSLFQQSNGNSEAKSLYEEQVQWCKEEGVDYIIAETMWGLVDSKIALEAIKSAEIPAVVTMAVRNLEKRDGIFLTTDGVPVPVACRELLELGATLVGVNCSRGPGTIIEVVEQICEVVPAEKVCALPIAYRTTPEEPTWHVLKDKHCPRNNPVYPKGFDPFYVSQVEITDFTKRCLELGLRYIGICCGNTGSYTRTMASAMGKESTLSKYHTKAALAQNRVEKMTGSILPSPKEE